MNIVKLLRNSSSPPSLKRRFFNRNEISIFLLSSLIGTYLDLYFVGKGLYGFPQRLLPEIFNINIVFTLVALPTTTYLLISFVKKKTWLYRWTIFLFISLIIAGFEKLLESCGLFIHSEQWEHLYSFFGYLAYLAVMWNFYKWIRK